MRNSACITESVVCETESSLFSSFRQCSWGHLSTLLIIPWWTHTQERYVLNNVELKYDCEMLVDVPCCHISFVFLNKAIHHTSTIVTSSCWVCFDLKSWHKYKNVHIAFIKYTINKAQLITCGPGAKRSNEEIYAHISQEKTD